MFLRTILYTLKRQLRDREAMTMLLLFPIVLILILGTALSGVFKPSSIRTTKAVWYNEDRQQTGVMLEEFISSEDMEEYLVTENVSSEKEGREAVSEGKAQAFIHIKEDSSINIYMQSASRVELAVIEGIFDSFENSANTIKAMISNGIEIAASEPVTATRQIAVSKDGKLPGSLDYYAVTMLVMTLMYGTLYGGIGVGEVFLEDLGRRLRTTPVNKIVFYSATVTGYMITIFTQGSIIVFFTKFVYGVYWGDNILMILLIILAMSFMSVSLGTLVGMLAKERRITTAILQTMVPLATFISSGYFKFQMPDPAIKRLVSSTVPNAIAQTAIFNTIYGGPAELIARMMIIMVCAGAVFILGSVLAGRRKIS
jgi:ABC-2 type transport system permease protein